MFGQHIEHAEQAVEDIIRRHDCYRIGPLLLIYHLTLSCESADFCPCNLRRRT